MSITPIRCGASVSKNAQEVLAISKYCNWVVANKGDATLPAKPRRNPHYKVLKTAVKDNLATHGSRTTCGSDILENYRSPFEATAVSRLANSTKLPNVVVTKTRMDEFGMGSHSTNISGGPVRNIHPYGDRSAGGSSGGSAVSVALEDCDLALGTDTGGSVRLPAAYTGVIGFKPSYGRISRFGLVPYANSLDTVGIFSRSIHKLRVAFAEMEGSDPRDPTTISAQSRMRFRSCLNDPGAEILSKSNKRSATVPRQPRSLRIGIPLEYNIKELHSEVLISWKRALEILQATGHQLVPISLPSTKHALSAYYVLAAAEAASNLAKYDGIRYGSRPVDNDAAGDALYSQTRGLGFGDEVKRRILLGSYTLSSEAIDNHFIQAQKVRRIVQRDFDRVFKQKNPLHPEDQFDLSEINDRVTLESKLGPAEVDFILCPTTSRRPPLIFDAMRHTSVSSYMNDVFTVPASLAGLPAISVPVSLPKVRAGLNVPWVGMQLIGQYWDDFRLIDVAADLLLHLESNDQMRQKNPNKAPMETSIVRKYVLPSQVRRVRS